MTYKIILKNGDVIYVSDDEIKEFSKSHDEIIDINYGKISISIKDINSIRILAEDIGRSFMKNVVDKFYQKGEY